MVQLIKRVVKSSKLESKVQKVSPRIRRRLVLASLIFWVPMILFLKLAEDVAGGEPILIDTPIAHLVWSLSSAWLSSLLLVLTHGGDTLFLLLATGLLAWVLWRKRSRRDMLAAVFAVGGAGLINIVLKLLFQRERPSIAFVLIQEPSFSFPSGHAMGSAALGITLLVMLWNTRWRWLAALIAPIYIFIVGFSRVYLGVHYVSDVVAGWCVSLVWVLVVYIALEHSAPIKRNLMKLARHK